MKRVVQARLRFLGRNIKQGSRLPYAELVKLRHVFREDASQGDLEAIRIDRALLHLLFDLKEQYKQFASQLQPVVDDYKTLISVMKETRNYSNEVFSRYQKVLRQFEQSKQHSDYIIDDMKYVKEYIEFHQHFSAKQFMEESKIVFNNLQREFVEFYNPIKEVVGEK